MGAGLIGQLRDKDQPPPLVLGAVAQKVQHAQCPVPQPDFLSFFLWAVSLSGELVRGCVAHAGGVRGSSMVVVDLLVVLTQDNNGVQCT